MDLERPFRGTDAVARGIVTHRQLGGSKYARLFPNIYLLRGRPADFRTRSLAAFLLVADGGALVGYSAAEILGARCAPKDAETEVVVPRRSIRSRPGLRVRRGRVADDEITVVDGVSLTTPARTAFDLARWLPLVEAVVALDALGYACGLTAGDIERTRRRNPLLPWCRRVKPVLELMNPQAESPMETRMRLALVLRGLPDASSQHWVDGIGGVRARLDLAYPDALVAIEYDGLHHRDRDAYATDRRRDNWLGQRGWLVLRFTSEDVLRRPDAMAAQVRAALSSRSAAKDAPGVTPPTFA